MKQPITKSILLILVLSPIFLFFYSIYSLSQQPLLSDIYKYKIHQSSSFTYTNTIDQTNNCVIAYLDDGTSTQYCGTYKINQNF